MSRKLVNLRGVFDIERHGPNYSDHKFGLTFRGSTPGGKDLDMRIELPAWGVEFIARKLHEVTQEHERFLREQKNALKGNL